MRAHKETGRQRRQADKAGKEERLATKEDQKEGKQGGWVVGNWAGRKKEWQRTKQIANDTNRGQSRQEERGQRRQAGEEEGSEGKLCEGL